MTGETHDNDEFVPFDDDRLDEDFVLEDLVEEDEGEDEVPLTDLGGDSEPRADGEEEEVDAEDLLFAEAEPASPVFEGAAFSEDADSEWCGDQLELDEESTDQEELFAATESVAHELGSLLEEDPGFALEDEAELEVVDEAAEAAAEPATFVLDDGEDLWSAVEEEESGADLELADEQSWSGAEDEVTLEGDVSAAPVAAEPAFDVEVGEAVEGYELFDEFSDVDESPSAPEEALFEASEAADEPGRFGAVSHELPPLQSEPASAGFDEEPEPVAEAQPESGVVEEEGEPAEFTLVDGVGDDVSFEAGWEPLPNASFDQLSEVDGVEHTDESGEVEYDTSGYEEDEVYDDAFDEQDRDEVDLDERDYAPEDLEDVEGHDIYSEDEEDPDGVVIGGPGSGRRRLGLALSVAASLAVVGLCAAVVGRPEWFGLAAEPQSVASVEVPRPQVQLEISEPAVVASPRAGDQAGEPSVLQPNAPSTEAVEPVPAAPAMPAPVEQGSVDPSSAPAAGEPEQPAAPQVLVDAPELPKSPVEEPQTDVATPPRPAIAGPAALPAAPAGETAAPSAELTRFGDQLLVGGMGSGETSGVAAVDGVLPGSRAFAQLANGNFFIGRVKRIGEDVVTLRVATGEVTLPREELVSLSRLGSADHESLQQVTPGSVRLHNNSRFIGGIRSSEADGHVVLEDRGNRVVLPASAVGEIVENDARGRVRLKTTTEEDGWLKEVAERELGAGRALPASQSSSGAASKPRR